MLCLHQVQRRADGQFHRYHPQMDASRLVLQLAIGQGSEIVKCAAAVFAVLQRSCCKYDLAAASNRPCLHMGGVKIL